MEVAVAVAAEAFAAFGTPLALVVEVVVGAAVEVAVGTAVAVRSALGGLVGQVAGPNRKPPGEVDIDDLPFLNLVYHIFCKEK